jgi:ribosomal protein S3AE
MIKNRPHSICYSRTYLPKKLSNRKISLKVDDIINNFDQKSGKSFLQIKHSELSTSSTSLKKVKQKSFMFLRKIFKFRKVKISASTHFRRKASIASVEFWEI